MKIFVTRSWAFMLISWQIMFNSIAYCSFMSSKAHFTSTKELRGTMTGRGTPTTSSEQRPFPARQPQGTLSLWPWDGTHPAQPAREAPSFTLQTEEGSYCPWGHDIQNGMPGRSFWIWPRLILGSSEQGPKAGKEGWTVWEVQLWEEGIEMNQLCIVRLPVSRLVCPAPVPRSMSCLVITPYF